jgi:hypothetical protein
MTLHLYSPHLMVQVQVQLLVLVMVKHLAHLKVCSF